MLPLLGPTQSRAADAAASTAPMKAVLPNGMRIICRRETDTPLVAVDVFVRVGASVETAQTAGLGNFVARTLFASTTSSPPETVTRDINALGGNVAATWKPDWTQISVLTVQDRFDNAVFLITDALKNANFDADVVKSTRQDILAEIDSRDADLFQTGYAGLRQSLYAGSSYALPSEGTADTLRRLTREDLVRYYNRYYVPKNFVFVVVGNVDPQTAIDKISEDMDDFPTQGRGQARFARDADPVPAPPMNPAPVHITQPDLPEVSVMVGYRVPSIASPDYPALLVANALLGGMKTSRLFTNLREKESLAYELGSVYSPQISASDLAGYVFAQPTRTDPVTKKSEPTLPSLQAGLERQFDSLKTTPPTPTELARAQHLLIGSYKIRHERLEDRAYLLGFAELGSPEGYKLDTDYAHYINAVTAADVQRVAAKYFVHPALSTVEPAPDNAGAVTR